MTFPLLGSPFAAKILDSSLAEHSPSSRLDSVSQATTSLESFSTSRETSEDEGITSCKKLPIDVTIGTPSGRVIPGYIYKRPDGNISVKFPREEIGVYLVNMVHKVTGKHISGSPYEVEVTTKIKQKKRKTIKTIVKKSTIGDNNCFSIYGTKDLDLNDLFIAVVGPSNVKLRFFQTNADSIDIIYSISTNGRYIFHVHEQGHKLLGSPFDVTHPQKSDGWTVCSVREPFSVYTITLWHGFDASVQHMRTQLQNPSGVVIPHSITRKGRHLVEIRYLPNMNGTYEISASLGDEILNKFLIKVNNYPKDGQLLKITGEGIHKAYVNETAEIKIESILATTRSFSVEFDGSDKIDISQSKSSDGKLIIYYKGYTEGMYLLSIKYDGFHVASSPYHVCLTNPDNCHQLRIENNTEGKAIKSFPEMCRAYGPGLTSARCGKLSCFTVDALNAGSGSLMAGFDSGNRKSIMTEVICKHIGNCMYNVQYKLDYQGLYKLSVLWAGSHIPGSPFTVTVVDENNNY